MDHLKKILIFDQDKELLSLANSSFQRAGFEIITCSQVSQIIASITKNKIQVLVIYLRQTSDKEEALLCKLGESERYKNLKIFVLTPIPYLEICCRLMAFPSIKIITLPLMMADIIKAIKLNLSLTEAPRLNKNAVYSCVTESLRDVLGSYLGDKLEVGDVRDKASTETTGEILAVIPLSSESFFGTLALSFSQSFASIIVNNMLGLNPEETVSEEDSIDVISEMSNQIAGLIKDKLNEFDIKTNIGLPKAISGKKLHLVHPGLNSVGIINLTMKDGRPLAKIRNLFQRRSAVEFCFDQIGSETK